MGSETFFYPNGTLMARKVRALSTTYPQAVAGIPSSIRFAFNRETGAFQLNYTTLPGKAGGGTNFENNTTATEIFLNEAMWYPKGFDVTLLAAVPEADPAGTKVETWEDATAAGVLTWRMRSTNY